VEPTLRGLTRADIPAWNRLRADLVPGKDMVCSVHRERLGDGIGTLLAAAMTARAVEMHVDRGPTGCGGGG
jgi:hypothetical protein